MQMGEKEKNWLPQYKPVPGRCRTGKRLLKPRASRRIQSLRGDKTERGGHGALPVVKREEQEFAGLLFGRRRWRPTPTYRCMRRSFATLSQEPRQGYRPTRNRLKRQPWRSRSHQDPASLEIIQPLFDRRLLVTLDSADLSHRLSSKRNRDGPAFAHVPDDLRKPRFCFVD